MVVAQVRQQPKSDAIGGVEEHVEGFRQVEGASPWLMNDYVELI